MFVVTITIEEHATTRVLALDPEDPPMRVWSDRTLWSHDRDGYQQGAADVLERATLHAAEGLPPKKDPRPS